MLLGVPIIYVGMKLFSKKSRLGKKFIGTWSELFWNIPLRTFVELYIEISLGFFLHSQNIRFMTMSGIVASVIMFIAGLFVIFYPFIVLSVISRPPIYVKSKTYDKKYGTLTEDVYRKRTMFQRAYYPLFVFHRIILTLTLVVMYDYPLIQLGIIFIVQSITIRYLIKWRPFKSELQQVIVVSDEFTIIFGLILLYFIYRNQGNIKTRARLGNLYSFNHKVGMGIVSVIWLSFIKNIGIIVYIFITKSYIKFRNWAHRKLLKINTGQANRSKMRRARRQQLPRIQNECQEVPDNNSRSTNLQNSNNTLSKTRKSRIGRPRK